MTTDATQIKAAVLDVLEHFPVLIAGEDDHVLVTTVEAATLSMQESSRLLRRCADALTARGFEVGRSRTRMRVWRPGTRPGMGPPDVVCRRGER